LVETVTSKIEPMPTLLNSQGAPHHDDETRGRNKYEAGLLRPPLTLYTETVRSFTVVRRSIFHNQLRFAIVVLDLTPMG